MRLLAVLERVGYDGPHDVVVLLDHINIHHLTKLIVGDRRHIGNFVGRVLHFLGQFEDWILFGAMNLCLIIRT